ncbi:MAG: gliding motility-associated C-terminal domain-containing protein [Bacteroidota bacterium]
MRSTFLLLFLSANLSLSTLSKAQSTCNNLVFNGSFEEFTDLPTDQCDWALARGWTNASRTAECSPINGTPDYYHRRGNGLFAQLPDNFFASVLPREGDALMGLLSYAPFFTDAREYLSTELTCTLIPGQRYTFSFYLNQGTPNIGGFSTNGLGMQLSVGPIFQPDGCNCPMEEGSPQYLVPDVVDAQDWQQFTYTFVADQPYDHLTLGCFLTDDEITARSFGPANSLPTGYYFIDEVSLVAENTVDFVVDLGDDISSCDGTAVRLDAGDFACAEYLWSTGETTSFISPSNTGIYSVTVTDACGVTQTDEVAVVEGQPSVESIREFICPGETYRLYGIDYTEPGNYTSRIDNGGSDGCDLLVSLELVAREAPSSFQAQRICVGESYVFNGQELTQSGRYQEVFPAASANDCDSIAILELSVESVVEENIAVQICEGEQYELNGQVYDQTGQYTQVLSNADPEGCDSLFRLDLEMVQGQITLRDTTLLRGSNYLLQPQLEGGIDEIASIQWEPSQGLSCDNCLNPTFFAQRSSGYRLLLEDILGCTYEASIGIEVNEVKVYIPNAFSPNQDGQNEEFFPFSKEGVAEEIVRFQVFDRWGSVVFASNNVPLNDASYGWDGRMNGRELPSGVYTYFMDIRLSNGERRAFRGDVSLLR